MGGNALKSHGVTRVDPATYVRIRDLVICRLLDSVAVRAQAPLALADKADYGDVDILVELKCGVVLRDWIVAEFRPRAIVHNGNIWSFNVENTQVDIITTDNGGWEMYFNYLSWGDLSNILGRAARSLDLKFGIDGLWLLERDPTTHAVIATYCISKSPRDIYAFMGYDFNRWECGFTSTDEIREFLFSSPRISRNCLNTESENTKHRRREKNSRTNYIAWCAWFNSHLDEFPEHSESGMPQSFDAKVTYIEQFFPECRLHFNVDTARRERQAIVEAREKFSGTQIKKLFPDLTNSEFGAFMARWNSQWPSKLDQAEYILDTHPQRLEYQARQLHQGLAPQATAI
jgi:hypothetical protein